MVEGLNSSIVHGLVPGKAPKIRPVKSETKKSGSYPSTSKLGSAVVNGLVKPNQKIIVNGTKVEVLSVDKNTGSATVKIAEQSHSTDLDSGTRINILR